MVETLFESELFGYVKGAFTGAATDKMGLMEFAHGGTLFLDEIGDMPLSTQAKLLRALQNQEVTRVGSVTPRKVDVRVIAATNRDVQDLIAQKQFREDLYYRLAMVELQTPALADRREDLPLLEKFLLDRFATQFNKDIRGLTRRAQIVLARHSWPGNIRELENVLGACLHDDHQRHDRCRGSARIAALRALGGRGRRRARASARSSRRYRSMSTKKGLLADALERAGGNQSEAARMLRISRDRLRYKMAKYDLR